MSSLKVGKNDSMKSVLMPCYYCKKATMVRLEETNGVQITDKYMCDTCLDLLLKGLRKTTPELYFKTVENLIQSNDSKEFFDITRKYDPYVKQLENDVQKLTDENAGLRLEIASLEEQIITWKGYVDTLQLTIENNENQYNKDTEVLNLLINDLRTSILEKDEKINNLEKLTLEVPTNIDESAEITLKVDSEE